MRWGGRGGGSVEQRGRVTQGWQMVSGVQSKTYWLERRRGEALGCCCSCKTGTRSSHISTILLLLLLPLLLWSLRSPGCRSPSSRLLFCSCCCHCRVTRAQAGQQH